MGFWITREKRCSLKGKHTPHRWVDVIKRKRGPEYEYIKETVLCPGRK